MTDLAHADAYDDHRDYTDDPATGTDIDGVMPCDTQDRAHRAHVWRYYDKPTDSVHVVGCHGLTWSEVRELANEGGRCCSDPMCPCDTKPGWSLGGAGAMNYPDLA